MHQLVTLADLGKFKEQIFLEMRRLLSGGGTRHSKQWLKSREVRKLLDVSPGKLHAMRASRQITFMRIGGVIYYDRADIEKMFEKCKTAMIKRRKNDVHLALGARARLTEITSGFIFYSKAQLLRTLPNSSIITLRENGQTRQECG